MSDIFFVFWQERNASINSSPFGIAAAGMNRGAASNANPLAALQILQSLQSLAALTQLGGIGSLGNMGGMMGNQGGSSATSAMGGTDPAAANPLAALGNN